MDRKRPDLYRLARTDTRGVRHGLTRVKQLLAAGANVAFASNNVRDVFQPLGYFDLLEESLVLSYGAHMDTIDELETLVRMCTENAALVDRARRRFVLKNGRLLPGMDAAADDQTK